MKFFVIPIVYAALALACGAQTTNVVKGAKISEIGIFKARVVQQGNMQAQWKSDGVDNVSWVQATTNIPARAGLQFGFCYNISGSPTNAPIPVEVTHIQPQYRDPKTGATTVTNVAHIQSRIGKSYLLYTLENADLVPGSWKFSISYEGKKLCEQGFVVGQPYYPPPYRPAARVATNAAPATKP
jgi:hypothetical protein